MGGGAVVEVLIQDQLDAWINTYGLEVTCVRPQNPQQFLSEMGPREWAYIIDLSNMTIVWKAFGSFASTTNSSAKQGLIELNNLLGI